MKTARGAPYGEDNGNSSLTEQQVLDLRTRWQTAVGRRGTPLIAQFASEYNVSKRQIRNVLYRVSWPHI